LVLRAGSAVAKHCAWPARENGSHSVPLGTEEGVADGEDTRVDPMKPPRPKPAVDKASVEPPLPELPGAYDTVLMAREVCQ
jgi:hypothetical protein